MQFDTRSLWIYLHFPRLQLNVLERGQNADLKTDEPRAIYEQAHNQLVQINPSAQARGIKTGMGLASASLLYPDLALHEYCPKVENNTLEHLANAIYLLSSDIVLMPPNGIVLRAQHMLKLYGGLQPYWHIISQCLVKQGLDYQSGAAFSIQAAKLMAKQGIGRITEDRKSIQSILGSCALALSDIEIKDLDKLKRIGIHSMAELNQVPLSELANRISRISLNIVSELRGQSPSKVTFFKPLTQYEDYIELLYDISIAEKLIPVITHTLNKLSDFLYVRNARCLQIQIDFYQREHQAMPVIFDSAMPIYQSEEWLSIIELKLEQLRFESPVYGLKLYCHQYEVAELANDDFFVSKSTHIAAMSLLSRLASKLGNHKICGLKFVDDFRPEQGTQYPGFVQVSRHHNTQSIFADRPGLLLPKPTLLVQQVKVIKGPERIVCGWWDENNISRDYYIGQSEQGQQIWMFKTPDQKWYLHGYFV